MTLGTAIVGAGTLYFAIAFVAGFGLGALRELVVAPRLGPLAAVAIEVPVMLAISWIAARRIVARFALPVGVPRLGTGLVAFALLQAAEVALGLALGTSLAAQAAALATLRGLIGFAAQIVFALLPLAVARTPEVP